MLTLRISAILALAASYSAASAGSRLSQFYTELLKGAPLPTLTNVILWASGALYWMLVPLLVVSLYLGGRKSEPKRQRFAEGIMILGTASTILFMIGSILPMATITVYFKD
jgi:hypothetical protein